ncbi:hypothetical protein PCK2_000539 [Pneumocystis canis]|nr:hypothetical protein PCK2_000539 [Pneumocystis canis]
MTRSRKSQKSINRQNLINISSKSSIFIEPPKKVIRALYDYVSQSSVELAFSKGDFFHVIGNENDEHWYEACNPATNVRGLVPVSYFEVLGRTEKDNLDIKNIEKLNDEKNYTKVPIKKAGRTGKRRILPYMPVPLSYIDDEISQRRCIDLDTYLRNLCRLPSYIKQSSLVMNFFFLKEGDIESDTPIIMTHSSYIKSTSKVFQDSELDDSFLSGDHMSLTSYKKSVSENDLSSDVFSSLTISEKLRSNFDIKGFESKRDFDVFKLTEMFQNSSIPKNEYIHSSTSQTTLKEYQPQVKSNFPQDNTMHCGICSDSLYIKIKIYFENDLIAIRVPRQITFTQLMEKLQDRLGTVIKSLRCKETNNHVCLIRCDNDLRDLINQNSKLVLYVE